MKRYLEQRIENMRDIGGYCTLDNTFVRKGQFIRSNVPLKITQEDKEVLKQIGITTVIDVRTKQEYQKRVCPIEKWDEFSYFHYEIKEGQEIPKSQEEKRISYQKILQANTMKQIFQIMSSVKGGVLYFCSAGKDRTGVITAILHLLANVAKEDIIKDYELTGAYLKQMLEEFQKTLPQEQKKVILPTAESMKIFLQDFTDSYGTAENYLSTIGLSRGEIANLKEKLIEKPKE